MEENIVVRGARTHNLKNITLSIPRNKMVVMTGLSGSGKSSLAFDTLYAEGQRRYVESLSAYARQFLELMDKPDVDLIEGLSPAIAIEQRTPSHNPRSTVGTVTEIYDYLRLLYARAGVPHCPNCGKVIKPQSAQQIIADVSAMPDGSQVTILDPLSSSASTRRRKSLVRSCCGLPMTSFGWPSSTTTPPSTRARWRPATSRTTTATVRPTRG
jgi:excinuclease ABC subunit A